jgi:hypothetical protein
MEVREQLSFLTACRQHITGPMGADGIRCVRAAKGLLAAIPLPVRLVALSCCLLAAGVVVIGLACGLAVRDGLMGQADQQLRGYAGLLDSRPFTMLPAGPGPDGTAGSAFLTEVLDPAGQLVLRTGADTRPAPAPAQIPARAGQLAAVRAGSGDGSWLVIAEPVHYRAKRILFTYGSNTFSLSVGGPAQSGTAGTLVVGLDLSSVGTAVRQVTVGSAAVGAAAVLAVAVAGLAVIRRIVRRHARSARESADRMHAGLAVTGSQLRRPLSVITGFAGYYRQRGPLTGPELDRMMDRVAAEAARMDALIDDLARLPVSSVGAARAGRGPRRRGGRPTWPADASAGRSGPAR